MKRALFALASLVLAGAAPALAQYAPPRPPMAIGPMAAADVADIVQAMGLDPVGPPAHSGPFYVQRAVDDFGRVLRVTVDARRSQVIAIEAAAWRQPYGLHAGYGVHRRPYPGYAIDPDDDFDLAPPGSVMAPRGQPPHAQPLRMQPPHVVIPQPHVQPPRPATKSAAVPPARAPVPRKRPAAAPEPSAAGSVEPVAPPQPAPAPVAAKPADPAAKPADPAPARPAEPTLTPVAPLE